MSLFFTPEEYQSRKDKLIEKMQQDKLDAILLFAQESMYWLTGYDTFGFCFFQCLIVTNEGKTVLLTRSPDLRQARATSNIEDIVLWRDREQANPALDLRNLLSEMNLLGCKIGVEYRAHGLTAANGRLVDEQLTSFGKISDVSGLIDNLRLIKSPTEISCIRKAAELTDNALDKALKIVRSGAHEADILATMMKANFAGDGDFPANEYVIGSGDDALLCRYKSGRRNLSENDQLTLEWSGVYRHYHAPMMRTVIVGIPTPRHEQLYVAVRETLEEMEKYLVPGATFGDVFDANTRILEQHDLTRHRFNACGYSIGARFTPSWMEMQQFHVGNSMEIQPNMTLFAHVMIFDSETNTAMTLARSYLITENGNESLSRHPLDLITC
ncbi:M24 family metallopeptidase [Bartonella sp. LJL80]